MEITIKRYSRKMTYEDAATLDEFWELAKRTERSLDREQRRHWGGRECDEYIIAAAGLFFDVSFYRVSRAWTSLAQAPNSSGSVRQTSYSDKDGSPMETPDLR